LCDEAKETIERVGAAADFDLEVISIETDPTLFEKYKDDIPVILINGVEAFRHRVDEKEFIKVLASR
jgi:hypothetical protein